MAFPLAGKTAFITGASRGIGLEIGKFLAKNGANVAVAAKTADPHPRLPGTIHTAVEEIDAVAQHGAKGLALQLDIREADKVEEAIERTVERFGNLDIVVNNASAINMTPTVEQTPKSYDLINSINARGTWLVSRYALPHLLRSADGERNPHILSLSPPLDSNMFRPSSMQGSFPEEFRETRAAYTMSKFGMSLSTFALAAETLGRVGCNTLWPFTLIGTSAMKIVSPNADTEERRWRSPAFVAEAALRILTQDAKTLTGRFFIDEVTLRLSPTFDNDTIPQYNLGGPDIPLEELADDLFISQSMRDLVKRTRQGKMVDGVFKYPTLERGETKRRSLASEILSKEL